MNQLSDIRGVAVLGRVQGGAVVVRYRSAGGRFVDAAFDQLPVDGIYPALHRLCDAGWVTSWLEPEHEWLAGAPPGCGPGRRRTYYALTSEGHRAAGCEISTRAAAQKGITRR